jgi:hypothetical protein
VQAVPDPLLPLGLDFLTFLAATVLVIPVFKSVKASPVLGFLFSGLVLGQLGCARCPHLCSPPSCMHGHRHTLCMLLAEDAPASEHLLCMHAQLHCHGKAGVVTWPDLARAALLCCAQAVPQHGGAGEAERAGRAVPALRDGPGAQPGPAQGAACQ